MLQFEAGKGGKIQKRYSIALQNSFFSVLELKMYARNPFFRFVFLIRFLNKSTHYHCSQFYDLSRNSNKCLCAMSSSHWEGFESLQFILSPKGWEGKMILPDIQQLGVLTKPKWDRQKFFSQNLVSYVQSG